MISTHVLYSEVLYDGRDTVLFFQRSVVLVVYVHDFLVQETKVYAIEFLLCTTNIVVQAN